MILFKECLLVRYNSDWLGKLNFSDVILLASNYTVAQLLERDDFSKRFKAGTPISVHELMYPLAQAYDSFAIDADVELGGTDQKFNLLCGREIQRAYGKNPQCILTMPILEGTDGVQKMSKSLDNYIALTDTPRDIFGKVMSIPDELISRYMRYGAFLSDTDCNAVDEGLKDGSMHPRTAKVNAAMAIVALYYGQQAGKDALEEFERIFKQKDIPDDVPEMNLAVDTISLLGAMLATDTAPSKNEARRLITQGGVSVDSVKIDDPFFEIKLDEKHLLKVGKRKFVYILK